MDFIRTWIKVFIEEMSHVIGFYGYWSLHSVELGSRIQVVSMIIPSLVPTDPFIGQVKDLHTSISDPGDKMQNHNLIYTPVKIHSFHLDRGLRD